MEAAATQPAVQSTIPVLDEIQKNHELIDTIVYLASLASRHEDIDGMLDTLRVVTARWDQSKPLDPTSKAALVDLQNKLKIYLVNSDPMRSLTTESLEQRIREQQAPATKMEPTKKSLIVIIVASLVAAGIAFVIPPYTMEAADRLYISTPLFIITMNIGIAWFYLTARRNFKPDVRRMLNFISASVVMIGLAFSYFGVLQIFGLAANPFLQYIGVSGLFVVAYFLIWYGLKLYADLLGISVRYIPLLVTYFVVGAAFIFIPHAPAENEVAFRIGVFGVTAISLLGFMAGMVGGRIRKKVTAGFAKPITMVTWYMYLTGVGGAVGLVAFYFVGDIRGDTVYNAALAGTFSQMVFLYSGYLFKKNAGK